MKKSTRRFLCGVLRIIRTHKMIACGFATVVWNKAFESWVDWRLMHRPEHWRQAVLSEAVLVL